MQFQFLGFRTSLKCALSVFCQVVLAFIVKAVRQYSGGKNTNILKKFFYGFVFRQPLANPAGLLKTNRNL